MGNSNSSAKYITIFYPAVIFILFIV